jgi:hypothetical protein
MTHQFAFFVLVATMALSSCSNKRVQHAEQTEEDIPDRLIELPVYTNSKNYKNNLSEVAEEVHFIKLSENVLLNDFEITGIMLSKDYIFLPSLYYIHQYTRNGEYVRDIGKRGPGPADFIHIGSTQLDNEKEWIYALDQYNRIVVYDFNGHFIKSFSVGFGFPAIALTDTNIIARRQDVDDRRFPKTSKSVKISFIDTNGDSLKHYNSSLYPYKSRPEMYGGGVSLLWEWGHRSFYLENASDTIFEIQRDTILPRYLLTGSLKPSFDEYHKVDIGGKNKISPEDWVLKFDSAIFESDEYIIFNMRLGQEFRYYVLYNKKTKELFRTYYDHPDIIPETKLNPEIKLMNYFVDDIYSGFHFTPKYQSGGYAMALIPTEQVLENKETILERLKDNSSPEAQNLKQIVENMGEFDNSLLMMVKFK